MAEDEGHALGDGRLRGRSLSVVETRFAFR
jgi:hypothetical protein